jgi:hypothetical protein
MPFGKLRTPARVTAPDLGATGAVSSHKSAMRWVGHSAIVLNARKTDCAIVHGYSTRLWFFLLISDWRARSWEAIHPRLQTMRQYPRLLRPTRSIGFARDADVVIVSTIVPVTLIWIKRCEIGAQVGWPW